MFPDDILPIGFHIISTLHAVKIPCNLLSRPLSAKSPIFWPSIICWPGKARTLVRASTGQLDFMRSLSGAAVCGKVTINRKLTHHLFFDNSDNTHLYLIDYTTPPVVQPLSLRISTQFVKFMLRSTTDIYISTICPLGTLWFQVLLTVSVYQVSGEQESPVLHAAR